MDTILYIFHGFRLTNQIVAFGASDPLFFKSGYLGSDFILYMNSTFIFPMLTVHSRRSVVKLKQSQVFYGQTPLGSDHFIFIGVWGSKILGKNPVQNFPEKISRTGIFNCTLCIHFKRQDHVVGEINPDPKPSSSPSHQIKLLLPFVANRSDSAAYHWNELVIINVETFK